MTLRKNNSNLNMKNNSKNKLVFSNKGQLRLIISCVVLFLATQVFFWYKTENIKPNLGIVPEVPTTSTIKAFSFGDEEFYFRYKAFRIQNAGDTFGRFSPLKNYDYKKLYEWFKLLDTLDDKANYVPSLAAYYYSMTQNHKDVIYVINYLVEHADKNPKEKWWWYYQATYLANNVYEDKDLAIEIAKKLRDYSPLNAPLWTKQMLPILLSDKGEKCEAIRVLSGILEEYEKTSEEKSIKDEDLNFMRFFMQKKMEELKADENFDPRSCL